MTRCITLLLFLPGLALAASPKLADGFSTPPRFRATEEREIPDEEIVTIEQRLHLGPVAEVERRRNFDMEIGLRGRSVAVPKSILDIWFFDESDEGWAHENDRPRIKGSTWGLEFVVKGASANGIFYVDYVDSNMSEGYWDDRDESSDGHGDHLDGDYLLPSPNLGLAAFGADYAYEVQIVRTDMTHGYYGLSLLVGGGLGLGVLVGSVDRWGPASDGTPSFQLYDEGDPPNSEKSIPPVFPMVDVNAGLRMNFANKVVLRFEGGLHTLVYWGGTVGYMF